MRVVRPGGRRPQRQARAAAHGLRGQAGKHTNDPRVFGCHCFKIIKIIAFVVALLTVCPHQRDATSSTIADDLDIKRRELEDLDRNLRRLRSEQDRAAAAGESALKLRLRREELFSAQVRPATSLQITSNHFKAPFRRGTPVLSFAHLAIHLDHLITHAIEHARTYAGAPRRVTRREETRHARDFWERRGRLHGLHFGRFRPRRRS